MKSLYNQNNLGQSFPNIDTQSNLFTIILLLHHYLSTKDYQKARCSIVLARLSSRITLLISICAGHLPSFPPKAHQQNRIFGSLPAVLQALSPPDQHSSVHTNFVTPYLNLI
jgi:hypothetical protein